MKLIPNRAMLQDKRIIFCDDSIVRGTQLHDNVKILFDYGAKKVHMRIGCPPLIYGCPFIGFTASKSDMELITRQIIKDNRSRPMLYLLAPTTPTQTLDIPQIPFGPECWG